MASHSTIADIYLTALPSVRGKPLREMPRHLYTYVWKVSRTQQIRLCLLTVLIFPLSLAPLELQRRIVDDAIKNGLTELLWMLGGLYLLSLILHGGLKYARNIYQNRVSEGVIRLLRRRVVRHEEMQADADAGTRQSIIASEAELLGAFVGESVSFPFLQAGIVTSIAGYMLIVEPVMAVIAIGFFVPSLLIVPFIQKKVNALAEERTTQARELGENVLQEENDRIESSEALIETIYGIRIRIFYYKYLMKFLNNLIGHLGPLSILMVGRLLVIQGQTEFGTIVAFISGYERMINPARDLLNFYRRLSAMRVQYRLVRDAASEGS